MTLTLESPDLVKTEFASLPVAEMLGKPVTVLLGVSDDAAAALRGLDIESVFDLALSHVFAAAVELDDAAENAANTFSRFGAPPADVLSNGAAGTTKVSDLRFQPIGILAGIPDAAALQTALGVVTVRDLAVYPPYRAARALLQAAFFPEQDVAFDPEAPADLVPKTGEFTTERVQYTTLVLDHLLRPDGAPPLIDIAGPNFAPVDIAPVADPSFGFQTLGIGAMLTFNQSWFMQGVTLGHLLHSAALAPGESTRIAVVDWSRRTNAGQTEFVGESEDVAQDTSRNRSISEVTEAVAREAQTGFSHTESESTTKQAGASGGFSIGPVGFGGSASISKTSTSADSYATTAGSREVGASMLQQANDRTHQHAHASRTRRASVVREVSQTEHESVSTRVLTNYNHMHAMTVQYYEVLQVYRTETSLVGCDRVVFVPFKLVDFADEDVLRRFRGALIDAALTPAVRDALVNYDTIELVPDRKVHFPILGGNLDTAVIDVRMVRPLILARPAPGGGADGVDPADGTPPTPPAPPVHPAPTPPDVQPTTQVLWANVGSRLASILGTGALRRGSESLFVPSDVRVVDGAVSSPAGDAIRLSYNRADGTSITDLTLSVPLAEIASISLTGSSATAAVEATATLTLARNGVIFPLELPTVTVDRGSASTPLVRLQAASADVNLVDHLSQNRLHYSQAVFRALDAAMIAGLLAPFSIQLNGQTFPLVQVAEPNPLRIVGNALAFRINTDAANDEEWRGFMRDRGLDIGEAKVDLVPLSSGGIFAEAVLGRFNAAEKLDLTRFWNWQDSPIPIAAPEIAAIQTGSRATPEDLKGSPLEQPIVSITPAAALPDPTGMAGILAAIQNGGMFRDMSGLSETVKLATEAIKASSAGATSVGQQASKNMEVAVTADTERQKIAAQLAAALAGKPLGDKSESAKGAAVNEVDKRAKAAEAGAGNGAAGSAGGAAGTASGSNGGAHGSTGGSSGGGTTSSTAGGATATRPATPSTGNVALDHIVGNDDLVRRFIGMSDDSPVPTPPVTAEGVPLQEWDIFGVAYSLMFKATSSAEPDYPSEAQLEQIVTAQRWLPTRLDDFKPLLLGDDQRTANTFGTVLLPLSLAPTGSVQKLNIVAYAAGTNRLAFQQKFVFDASQGETLSETEDETFPLSVVDLNELLAMTGDAPIQLEGGTTVRLADVRKAFPVDGEVRVFNLYNPLQREYVQALANFFQVRTTAFVEKPVRVLAEVIATTDEASERVLAKKIDVGFIADPPGPTVDYFDNLLTMDRSGTGAFTAFPRR
jgi:hypothetical protein